MFEVNPLPSMTNQALFSSKDKSKILKCSLLQFLFGALRVKQFNIDAFSSISNNYLSSAFKSLSTEIENS